MVQPILSCNHVGIKKVSYVERNYILKCLLCTSYIDRACFEISRFNGTTYLKKLYIRKQCYWYYIKDLALYNVLILISIHKTLSGLHVFNKYSLEANNAYSFKRIACMHILNEDYPKKDLLLIPIAISWINYGFFISYKLRFCWQIHLP